MSLLEIHDLSVSYGDLYAVRGVSFAVEEGAVFVLLGANGAGKTSILRAISGLVAARGGRIALDGRDLAGLVPNQVARAGIAHVPEGRRVFPTLTVDDNLSVSFLKERSKDTLGAALDAVYQLFPRLAERRKQLGGTLSGGEQQMLAIGRCLMGSPELIMFDEPSLGLAPAVVHNMLGTIRDLNRDGLTCLLVEQNVALSLKLASRAYVLENGRITLTGTGTELLADDRVRSAYLGL